MDRLTIEELPLRRFGALSAFPVRTLGTAGMRIVGSRCSRTARLLAERDRDGECSERLGRDMVAHATAVLESVGRVPAATASMCLAALLHDFDDFFPGADVARLGDVGYDYRTVRIVDELTFDPKRTDRGTDYWSWLEWIAQHASGEARAVKYAAMSLNVADSAHWRSVAARLGEKVPRRARERLAAAAERMRKAIPDDALILP